MEYVKYVGLAHERQISATDWRMAGVPDQGSLVWSHVNGFSVPVEQLTDRALEVLRTRERDQFVVVGGEENAPRFLDHPMTPQQADGPRVDMTALVGGSNASTASSGSSEA